MHYCLELIMPPTDDVKAAVEQILAPFREENTDPDASRQPFWDWYIVGGRWSGHKLKHMDEARQSEYLAPKDTYTDNFGFPDVCTLRDLPAELRSARVIVAGPGYGDKIEAQFMIEDSIWNGVTIVKTDWDGSVLDAIKRHGDRLKHYRHELAEKLEPQADWLVVTIDYHS